MVIPIFKKYRKPKPRPKGSSTAPPPPPPPAPAPELVAASFDSDAAVLLMAFDEEINIDALDLSQVALNDQPVPGIPHLADPQTLFVLWEGPAPEGDIELSATDSTGIVAAAGGAPWAGSSGVALPFP